jgi:hypothetical protein
LAKNRISLYPQGVPGAAAERGGGGTGPLVELEPEEEEEEGEEEGEEEEGEEDEEEEEVAKAASFPDKGFSSFSWDCESTATEVVD